MVDSHSRKLFDKNGMLIVKVIELPEEPKKTHDEQKAKKQKPHSTNRIDERVRVIWEAIAQTFPGKKVPYKEVRAYFENKGIGRRRFAWVCKRLESEGKIKVKRKYGRMTRVEVLA